jgi:hypothetical protein
MRNRADGLAIAHLFQNGRVQWLLHTVLGGVVNEEPLKMHPCLIDLHGGSPDHSLVGLRTAHLTMT